MSMSEIEVRLESLKLAHSHAYDTGVVLEKAKAYEAYIMGPAKSAVPASMTLGLPGRKAPTPTKVAG